MERALVVSAFVAADPRPSEAATVAELLADGGISAGTPCVLPLAPGVALAPALTADRAPLALRWFRISRGAALLPGGAQVAVVLTGSLREAGRALRLVGRLRAGLAEGAVRERIVAATTREDLVRALAAVDHNAGESPLDAAEVLAIIGSRADGLDDIEAARRAVACGPNVIEHTRRRPLVLRMLEQLVGFFAVLLWVGGGLALLAGMPELGWAIFGVIVVNGAFSFVQEYRAERAIVALQALLPHEMVAVRAGRVVRLPAERLVPGDIVRLGEGDQVPADGQLVSAEGLRVDQSALTGESHAVFKLPVVGDARARVPGLERHELLFAGTGVVAGAGVYVVSATGMATEIGGVAMLTQAVRQESSPLQREMARVTRIVTALAVAVGTAFFVLSVTTGLLRPGEGFVFALGVIVANVPEGLLPTLTLALALGVQRMARRGSLVKRLSAVETLGAATVICTDKTGTLTEGRMALRAVWVDGLRHAAAALDAGDDGVRALLEAAVLASQATAEHGDPTEVALVATAARLGVDAEKLRRERPLRAAYPFDSFRKRMTLVRGADQAVAYVKGAPRETLALCERLRLGERLVALDPVRRDAFLAEHDRLAREGLRLLVVACRAVAAAEIGAPQASVERGLTLLGLVALWDPPRAEVPGAVALCERAGIRVVVVTGDYGLTAQAIARGIGLRADKVVTGAEVERASLATLTELAREPGVLFARMSPAHKLAVVQALTAAGEVVAVTGDGVNDAPALKAAAIGVAMGRRGTEVAKEAAEMVITDDNFASIVAAIGHGRATYSNMGKFVSYIFASNVPELVPFLAFILAGIPLPLTVMQILAVDLGTDLVPALALGAEPAEPGLMDRPPRRREERLLSARRLIHAYAFLGALEAALALGAFFWTYWLAGWRPGLPMDGTGDLYHRATTMTLAAIVAAQVGNVFACRTDRQSIFHVGLFANRLVLLGIAVEIAILLVLIATPPLREVFGLAPLAVREWGVLLLCPPTILGMEEARKWVVRRAARADRRQGRP